MYYMTVAYNLVSATALQLIISDTGPYYSHKQRKDWVIHVKQNMLIALLVT